ncbi:MAG TPA: hypothetical protein VG733_08365 [Chthoniobacteraceae bacterium]|nr:hypothetical protein [Chthoniobacteraceae bacterium]
MPPGPTSQSPKPAGAAGCFAIGSAVLSFIPGLGLFFGAVGLAYGIAKKRWATLGIACAGLLLNIVIFAYGAYFGIFKRGGAVDKARAKETPLILNRAVADLEAYKAGHGHYPASLQEASAGSMRLRTDFTDPIAIERLEFSNQFFYYELSPDGASYYLRSVGLDGKPFTADDIVPSLTDEELKNTGLKTDK